MPLYDYKCSEGHLFEGRAAFGDDTPVSCPACGQPSERQKVYIITPFTESGVRVGRVSSTPRDEKRVNLKKFQEASAEVDHAYKKIEESVGHPVETPSLYHEGLRQAKLVQAGLRPPPKEF